MSPKSFIFLRYLTTVFENIKDAVLLISIEQDGNFRLLLANKAFHNISGYGPECVGENLVDFIDPEPLGLLKSQYDEVVKAKKPMTFTTWANVPLGRRAYEADIIPVLSTVDEIVQIIILARDITKLTQLEEEVKQLRADSPEPTLM